MNNLQNAVAKELGLFNYKIRDTLNQFFIDTATYGLDLFEKEFGISTDHSKSYVLRRMTIKSKKIGAKTITKEALETLVLEYTGVVAIVTENNSNYSFTIKFVGSKGVPDNIDLLTSVIEEIKPAHLACIFEFSYTWWDSLKLMTWSEASNKTWNGLKVYT
jgi:hypothetical protein